MKFSIIIKSAPQSSISQTAIRFIEASINSGHDIYRVFFYQEGVHHATDYAVTPQDENNILDQWLALKAKHDMDLVVCVAAALRRGVINNEESKRYQKTGANLHEAFEISGLGQLVDASLHSDRVVTF